MRTSRRNVFEWFLTVTFGELCVCRPDHVLAAGWSIAWGLIYLMMDTTCLCHCHCHYLEVWISLATYGTKLKIGLVMCKDCMNNVFICFPALLWLMLML